MILIPAFLFHITKQLHIPLLIHREHLSPVHSIFTLCDSTLLLEPSQYLQEGDFISPTQTLCEHLEQYLCCSLLLSVGEPKSWEASQQRREAASISVMVDLRLICLKGNLAQSFACVTCQHPSSSDIRI